MTTRTIGFDERTRRYRRTGTVAALLVATAVFAMLAVFEPETPEDWTWPLLACLFAGLSLWSLTRRGGMPEIASRIGTTGAGQQRLFGNQPVRMRRSGRNCAIDAEDALRVMYLHPHETALRRLALRYGDEQFFQDENGRWWFDEAALLDWLQQKIQQGDPRAQRFRRWLEREALPKRRRRPVRQ